MQTVYPAQPLSEAVVIDRVGLRADLDQIWGEKVLTLRLAVGYERSSGPWRTGLTIGRHIKERIVGVKLELGLYALRQHQSLQGVGGVAIVLAQYVLVDAQGHRRGRIASAHACAALIETPLLARMVRWT